MILNFLFSIFTIHYKNEFVAARCRLQAWLQRAFHTIVRLYFFTRNNESPGVWKVNDRITLTNFLHVHCVLRKKDITLTAITYTQYI